MGLKIANPVGFNYIFRNFDGPLYTVAAKTFYDPKLISNLHLETSLSPEYFSAHLPLYPLLIRVFEGIGVIGGYLKSMIFVNILATVALTCFFYYFITRFRLTRKPIFLTLVFMMLPRFLVVRSVGAPESLFMFLVVLSIFFFEEKKYFLAGLFGGLSALTKVPGILLVLAYAMTFLEGYVKSKQLSWKYFWIALIPMGLLVTFILYLKQYGDFFAYFHTGGVVPMPFPYAAFNYQARWVGTAWLEDIIFYFIFYGLAVSVLWKTQLRSVFYFCVVFFVSILFIQHRDISRYALPLWPFSVIAFQQLFTSKKFLWIFFLIMIPAAYFYGWNFLLYNLMPISNWKPYL